MFVAWRDLRFAKGRFALMGTVIVLITLLVGLLSGLTAGLSRQSISAIADLPADEIVFQNPGSGQGVSYTNSALTQAQLRQWSEARGIEHAQPLGITTTKADATSYAAAVTAFGVEPGSSLAPAGTLLGAHTAVLSHAAAADLHLKTGDRFALAGQGLTVAAVRGDAYFSHTPVIWTSLSTWQQTAPPAPDGTRPAASVIALTTSGHLDPGALDVQAGTTTLATGATFSAIGSYTAENGSLQLMRAFLFAISAVVIGAFFTVWTIQRSGDVAVLKALGASTAHLLQDALGQAVILLAAGTLAGTAVAAGLGAAATGSGIPFVLSVSTIVPPAAVMILLGVLGAALSIRRITSVDPLTALGSAR